jgi:hypothetical protein
MKRYRDASPIDISFTREPLCHMAYVGGALPLEARGGRHALPHQLSHLAGRDGLQPDLRDLFIFLRAQAADADAP